MTLYLFLLIVIFGVILILAKKSFLLRDEITDGEVLKSISLEQKLPSYSLARVQVAFWTGIITSSFIYVYIHLEYFVPELNNANLILLGLSAGTIMSARLIDDSQREFKRHQNESSKGFFIDILSDEKGVSVHRLQNVIWTIIVGCIYVRYVAGYGTLPDDSVITDQLLILMGISEFTYIGIKSTENKKEDDTSKSIVEEKKPILDQQATII